MIIYDWPAILVANAETFRIDARTRSGGETISGREQVVTSNLGRWIARLTVPLHTPAKIRAMRSLLARLDGRTNAVRVGPCDCRNGNRLIEMTGGIPYDDDTFHTDGSGFSQGGASPTIAEDHPAAAGAFQITINNGSTRMPVLDGSFFGAGGYLYVVTGATALAGEQTLLDIRPKLRTALAVGAPIDWCHGRVPMRLSADDSGAFELHLARTGTATLDLVEVW
jgi:hypothetical protein